MKENVKEVFTRKKFWISVSIILLFIIAIIVYEFTFSVKGTPVSNKIAFPNAMAWNYQLIYTYKGHDYSVTKNIIPSSLVGWKIETEGWNGPSGGLYDIYSIKTELTYKQIAIKTKYGYLIANRGQKDPYR